MDCAGDHIDMACTADSLLQRQRGRRVFVEEFCRTRLSRWHPRKIQLSRNEKW